MFHRSGIIVCSLLTAPACGAKKPADKLGCGDGQIARGGECTDAPNVVACEAPLVRRGAQCLSPRASYCANWATNYPDCNQCPESYVYELGRCGCGEVACYEQAQCADPKEGNGRRLLFVDAMGQNNPLDMDPMNMKPSLAEIEENTGVEVSHRQIESIEDFSHVIDEAEQNEWDAIWVLDGGQTAYDWDHLGEILREKAAAGVGLAILADNEPFTTSVTKVLNLAKPSWDVTIDGNYDGQGQVSKEGYQSDKKGKLHDHEITTGLYEKVSEGVTISHVASGKIKGSDSYKAVLINTDGQDGVAAIEERLAADATPYDRAVENLDGETVQRTVIHTGFTSLYQHEDREKYTWTWNSQHSSGTPLLWFNMACWTTNVK